jgi:hypothetical protein
MDGWRLEVALGGGVSVGSGPPVADFHGTGLTYWIQPLRDDGHTPYALLSFEQQPDFISFDLEGSAPSGTVNLGASVTAGLFPWRSSTRWAWLSGTGVTASVGVSETVDGYELRSRLSAGIMQRVGRRLVLGLLYDTGGVVSWTGTADGSAVGYDFGSDEISLSARGLALDDRLLLGFDLTTTFTHSGRSATMSGTAAGSALHDSQVGGGALLAATVFPLRSLAAGAVVGLNAGDLDGDPMLHVIVGASLEYDLTPAVFARTRALLDVPTGGGLSSSVQGDVALSLGFRL